MNLSLQLPEDQSSRLADLARRLHTTPEELALMGIRELLARPDEQFEQAADYVLRKNAELYRRLA